MIHQLLEALLGLLTSAIDGLPVAWELLVSEVHTLGAVKVSIAVSLLALALLVLAPGCVFCAYRELKDTSGHLSGWWGNLAFALGIASGALIIGGLIGTLESVPDLVAPNLQLIERLK